MTPAAGRRAPMEDEGRIALLSLVFALIAIVVVLVVTSASAVHLQRKRLFAITDAAAADAADALDAARYYGPGGGVLENAVPLTDASVRRSVEAYLQTADAQADLPGIAIDAATGSLDGRTAEVVLTANLRPPFAAFVPASFRDGIRARATSRAVALLR